MNRGPNFKPQQLKTVDSIEPATSIHSGSPDNVRAKKYSIRTYRKKNMTKLMGNNLNDSDYIGVTRGKGRTANQPSISPNSHTTTSKQMNQSDMTSNMVVLSELGQATIPQSSQNTSKFVDKDGKSSLRTKKRSKAAKSKVSTDKSYSVEPIIKDITPEAKERKKSIEVDMANYYN